MDQHPRGDAELIDGEPIMRIPPVRYDSGPLTMQAASEQSRLWPIRQLKLPDEGWPESQGEGITVCVTDTAAGHGGHPDLPPLAFRANFAGGSSEDANGHGTHCLGIVGARSNEIGMVGVAPRCSLAVCKVLSDGGSGSSNAISRGIRRAVDEGAQVVSVSLGGGYSEQTAEACKYADDHGVFVICAAGNGGATIWPAKLPTTTSVTATNESGQVPNWPSRGDDIDIAAPGERIYSTYPGGLYRVMTGTSMACPHIAGIVALLKSAHNQGDIKLENTRDLRALLEANSVDLGPPGRDNRSGYGIPKVGDLIDVVEQDDAYLWI